MKFFRQASPVLVALALFLGIVPAFASEAPDFAGSYAPETGEVLTDDPDIPAPSGDGPVLDYTPPDTVTVSGADVTVYLDDRSYTSVIDVGGGLSPADDDIPSVSHGDSGTLPGFLRAMFGEYTPKTQIVSTYFDGQLMEVSTEYVPGIAGMDMEWIASVILFGLVVYCLFRMLGGMVR